MSESPGEFVEGKRGSPFRILNEPESTGGAHGSRSPVPGHESEGVSTAGLPEPSPKRVGLTQILGLHLLDVLYGRGSAGSAPKRGAEGGPLRVLRVVSSLTQGGVGKVCLQTVLALDADRVRSTILVFGEKRRQVEGKPWPSGIDVLARPLKLAPADGGFRFYRDVVRLSRIIQEHAPQIVHVHEPQFAPAVQAALGKASRGGARARLVVHLHNDYRQRTRSMPQALQPLIQRALRRSTLIACSRTIQEAAADWLGVEREGIALIEDGADDVAVDQGNETLGQELEKAAGEKVVLACMANLMPHKRVEDFIEACSRLSAEGEPVFCLLMVYGKKEMAESLRRFFESHVAPADGEMLYRIGQPHALFPRIDIGVSPSSLEGLGLNILEYQAHGIPVVCSDLQPHREMVENEANGLLYPVGDVEQLAERLRRLIHDRDLRRSVGEAGKQTARRRRWSDTAAATAQFYQALFNR